MKNTHAKRLFAVLVTMCILLPTIITGVLAEETVKVTDSSNFIRWYTPYFGVQTDASLDLIESNDGGYLSVGSTYAWSNHAYAVHAGIIKFAKNGAIEWSKAFGCGTSGNGANAHFYKVIQLKSGDYLAVGDTDDEVGISVKDYKHILAVRFDKTGNIKWQKAFGVENQKASMVGKNLLEKENGDLMILANISINSGYDVFAEITLDQNGNLKESYLISDDTAKSKSNATDIHIEKFSTDGSYLVTSHYFVSGFSWTGFVTSLDSSGKMKWSKYITPKDSNGNAAKTENMRAVRVADGFIVSSLSYIDSISKLFVFKLDFDGNLKWSKIFSELTLNNRCVDSRIYVTNSNDLLISVKNGYSTVDFTVLNLSRSDGSVNWVKTYGNKTGFERNYGGSTEFRLLPTNDNMIFGAGEKFITKLSGDGSINFESDDFMTQVRTNYKADNVQVIIKDGGFWDKFVTSPDTTIKGKDISYLVDGGVVENKVIASVAKAPKAATVVDGNLLLSWNAVNGAKGYNIYQSKTQGVYGNTPRTDFPVETTSFTDDQVDKDTTYYYQIRPVMSDGKEGAPIAEFSGIVSTKPENTIVLQIDNPNMEINGSIVELDPGRGTTPVIISGRTVLPIRSVVEAMGGNIQWDGTTQKISLIAKGITVEMWIDKKEIQVNGVLKQIDVAPVILNGRTMVPLRFAAENLDCTVNWEAASRKAVIIY